MKKIIKTLSLFGVAAAVTASLTSCGNGDADKPHLTIAINQNTGTTVGAMRAWLDAAQDELGFTYDTVLMDRSDWNKNSQDLKDKINSGSNGIITMVDFPSNYLKVVLDSCKEHDAYFAGWMTELSNAQDENNYLLDSDRIVGTVSDGESGAQRGEKLFEYVKASTERKVVFTQYDPALFPAVKGAVQRFIDLAEEYNKTATDESDKFTFFEGTGENYDKSVNNRAFTAGFRGIDQSFYNTWKNDGVEAIVSVNSLSKYLLPTMKADTTGHMKLYSVGYDDSTSTSLGDGQMMTVSQTPAETIFFPVVQLLNAINGKSYSDAPKDAKSKVATGNYIYVQTKEELAIAKSKILNFQGQKENGKEVYDLTKTIFTPADAKKLLASTSGSTYKGLTDTLASWTSQNIIKK